MEVISDEELARLEKQVWDFVARCDRIKEKLEENSIGLKTIITHSKNPGAQNTD